MSRIHACSSVFAGLLLLLGATPVRAQESKFFCAYQPEFSDRTIPAGSGTVPGVCSPDEGFIPDGAPYLEVTFGADGSLVRAGLYYRRDARKEAALKQRSKNEGGGTLTPLGLGTVGVGTGVMVDKVFTAIADMAVSRAKKLALDLAQEQIVSRCALITRFGMMNHLCGKLRDEPLLDLVQDPAVIRDAVLTDAIEYLTSRHLSAIPLEFRPTLKVIAALLADYAVARRTPRREDLHGVWNALRQSLAMMDDESDLKAVLMVGTTLMLASLEVSGNGSDVLQWSVFRDLAEPRKTDPRHQKEFLKMLAWGEALVQQKWPVRCDGTAAECEERRRQRMTALRFSYTEFVKTHPQYLLEMELWRDLSKYVGRLTSPKAQKWLNEFRVLAGTPDPMRVIPATFSLLIDFMVDGKRLAADACGREQVVDAPAAPEDPAPKPGPVEKQRKRELVLENLPLIQEIQEQLKPRKVKGEVVVDDGCTLRRRLVELEAAPDQVDEKIEELLKWLDELRISPDPALTGSKKLQQKLAEFAKKREDQLAAGLGRLKVRDEADVRRLLILRKIILAIFSQEHAVVLRGFIDLLQLQVDPKHTGLQKGIATLRLIVGLIEPGPEGETPKEAHKRRVELLEEFAGRMTSREDRKNEWIWSVGVSALMGFRQSWVHTAEGFTPSAFGDGTFAPDLSVPMGFTLQRFGKTHGLHVMLYPFDLAQYARMQPEGDQVTAPEPTFTTAFTFGLQAAWARLVRNIPLTVGLDLRYIPNIDYLQNIELPDGSTEERTRSTRQFQITLFVGFNFPLLDFN